MLTLVLNTAYNLKVTLIDGDKVVADLKSNEKKADKYMQIIDEILVENGYSFSQINQIAVNVGPGSFTGLRVAVSIVKGLAFGGQVKICAFTSFDCLKAADNENLVLPGFSDFVYVKQNGVMSCIKINELDDKKYLTDSEELISMLIQNGKNAELTEDKDPIDLLKTAVQVNSLSQLRPVYLRKSQAEIALEEKKKK